MILDKYELLQGGRDFSFCNLLLLGGNVVALNGRDLKMNLLKRLLLHVIRKVNFFLFLLLILSDIKVFLV